MHLHASAYTRTSKCEQGCVVGGFGVAHTVVAGGGKQEEEEHVVLGPHQDEDEPHQPRWRSSTIRKHHIIGICWDQGACQKHLIGMIDAIHNNF
jgi:hypothetical protein